MDRFQVRKVAVLGAGVMGAQIAAHLVNVGVPVVLFGVLPLPDLLPADEALAEFVKPTHAVAAYALAALAVLHVAAALKHQLIDRDGLLARMRPAR